MSAREPGEGFLEMAKEAVFVLVKGDSHIDELKAQGAFVCHPLCEGEKCEITLHDFFASAQSTEARAVVVLEQADEEVTQRAYREAALGMMDNPVYR
jgi:hypothetical protein